MGSISPISIRSAAAYFGFLEMGNASNSGGFMAGSARAGVAGFLGAQKQMVRQKSGRLRVMSCWEGNMLGKLICLIESAEHCFYQERVVAFGDGLEAGDDASGFFFIEMEGHCVCGELDVIDF